MLAIYNQYPTVTVFMALFLGAVFTMILMPFFIKFLRSRLIGQQVRDDGPQTHLVKQGTPTMGGVVMIIAMVLAALLLEEPTAQAIAIVIAIVLTGALGLFDDVSKVVYERSLGLTPKAKLIGQLVLCLCQRFGIPVTQTFFPGHPVLSLLPVLDRHIEGVVAQPVGFLVQKCLIFLLLG